MYKSYIEAYYEYDLPHQKRARELIKMLALKKNEKILDIGCGDGKLTSELAHYVPNGSVIGIDNSEQMIEFAKNKFPETRYSNLSFQYADTQSLDNDNEFDVIVSIACLSIIVNHTPVLLKIHQSLKNSGKVLLIFLGKGKYNAISSVISNLLNSQKWHNQLADKVSYGFYDVEEYSELLNKSGFKPERIELCDENITYEGKEALTRAIRTKWVSLSSRIPENLYEDFLSDLVETYLKFNPPNNQGLIHIQESWLEIEATKIGE